jgi:hypothetical protein
MSRGEPALDIVLFGTAPVPSIACARARFRRATADPRLSRNAPLSGARSSAGFRVSLPRGGGPLSRPQRRFGIAIAAAVGGMADRRGVQPQFKTRSRDSRRIRRRLHRILRFHLRACEHDTSFTRCAFH